MLTAPWHCTPLAALAHPVPPCCRPRPQVLNVVYTPTWGNEPHHVGLSNNTFLAVGGIQAYLRGNPDIYIFNTTQPDDPVFLKSVDPPLVSCSWSWHAGPAVHKRDGLQQHPETQHPAKLMVCNAL